MSPEIPLDKTHQTHSGSINIEEKILQPDQQQPLLRRQKEFAIPLRAIWDGPAVEVSIFDAGIDNTYHYPTDEF